MSSRDKWRQVATFSRLIVNSSLRLPNFYSWQVMTGYGVPGRRRAERALKESPPGCGRKERQRMKFSLIGCCHRGRFFAEKLQHVGAVGVHVQVGRCLAGLNDLAGKGSVTGVTRACLCPPMATRNETGNRLPMLPQLCVLLPRWLGTGESHSRGSPGAGE